MSKVCLKMKYLLYFNIFSCVEYTFILFYFTSFFFESIKLSRRYVFSTRHIKRRCTYFSYIFVSGILYLYMLSFYPSKIDIRLWYFITSFSLIRLIRWTWFIAHIVKRSTRTYQTIEYKTKLLCRNFPSFIPTFITFYTHWKYKDKIHTRENVRDKYSYT